jgi:hypothetical protein
MTTYNTRIYGHSRVTRLQTDDGQQGGTDSALVLVQPYIWAQAINLTVGGAAVSSTPAVVTNFTTDPTKILHIEVPDGQVIGYEVNEAARNVVASALSPRLAVSGNIAFGPGWTLSVIDMTGVA